MHDYKTLWFIAFVATLVLELPVYSMCLRRKGIKIRSAILIGLLLNGLTHPALWFLVPYFEPYYAWVAVMEILVFAIEAGLLFALIVRSGVSLRYAAWTAGAANSVSTLAGILWVHRQG